MAKRGLGRGLEALLPGAAKDEETVNEILITAIECNPNQPRKFFEDERLAELATSIREHGVVQPIIVRPIGDEHYQLIAGERRWRACTMLGLKRIPAVIKNIGEGEAREISLVENLQREDLNPLEEAEAYKELLQGFAFTQEGLAKRMGKSRPYIANTLRLLGLSEKLKGRVRQGLLTPGHAKVLLGVSDINERERLGNEIIEKSLSVRETEKLVQQLVESKLNSLSPKPGGGRKGTNKLTEDKAIDPEMYYWEERLRERMGTKVKLKWNGQGAGVIEIEFYGLQDLERIDEVLRGNKESLG